MDDRPRRLGDQWLVPTLGSFGRSDVRHLARVNDDWRPRASRPNCAPHSRIGYALAVMPDERHAVRMKRALVAMLAKADELLDEVLYRPAIVKASAWLPRWWRCDLALCRSSWTIVGTSVGGAGTCHRASATPAGDAQPSTSTDLTRMTPKQQRSFSIGDPSTPADGVRSKVRSMTRRDCSVSLQRPVAPRSRGHGAGHRAEPIRPSHGDDAPEPPGPPSPGTMARWVRFVWSGCRRASRC